MLTTGGNDAEAFTIDGSARARPWPQLMRRSTQYLALANGINVDVLAWSNSKGNFQTFQIMTLVGCLGVTSFSIDGAHTCPAPGASAAQARPTWSRRTTFPPRRPSTSTTRRPSSSW